MGIKTQHLYLSIYLPEHNKLQFIVHMLLQICARNKYAYQIGHVSHIYQISYVRLWGMHVHICATYVVHAFRNCPVQSGTDT